MISKVYIPHTQLFIALNKRSDFAKKDYILIFIKYLEILILTEAVEDSNEDQCMADKFNKFRLLNYLFFLIPLRSLSF